MTYFILQTLFWLLISFALGLILGRWLKRMLCNRAQVSVGSVDYSSENSNRVNASYASTADKLAFRERGEAEDIGRPEHVDSSFGAVTKGVATAGVAATAGAVNRAFSDDETELAHGTNKETDTLDVGTGESETEGVTPELTAAEDVDNIAVTSEVAEVTIDNKSATETIDTAMPDEIPVVHSIGDDEVLTDEVEEEEATETPEVAEAVGTPVATESVEVVEGDDTDTTLVDEDNELSAKGAAALGAAGVEAVGGEVHKKDSQVSNLAGIAADNLQIIEGIGPVMQETLNKNGIYTWHDLAQTNRDSLLSMFDSQKQGMVDAEFWIEQASLAAAGKTQELIQLQKADGSSSKFEDNFLSVIGTTSDVTADTGGESGASTEGTSDTEATGLASLQPDNLQIIEGIGPAMEKTLHNNGVRSWRDLASMEKDDLLALFEGQQGLVNAESWIEQASLAAEGKTQELIQLQKADGSSSKLEDNYLSMSDVATATSSSTNDATASSASEAASGLDFSRLESDALQVIEGIGPVMEKILHSNGVLTWQELAKRSEADIRAILDTYGDKYKGVEHLESWIEQAKLAAEGNFEELIRMQKVDGVSKLERKFGGILKG